MTVKTYTENFINEMAHPTNTAKQLVTSLEAGNELWGWPEETDYHQMLKGIRDACVNKYGTTKANWKLKFVAGAMQAWRDEECANTSRDVNNCTGGGDGLKRFDYIGKYLNVSTCNIITDLDAINVHPYSFTYNSLNYTYPEDPGGEFFQIRNLAKRQPILPAE